MPEEDVRLVLMPWMKQDKLITELIVNVLLIIYTEYQDEKKICKIFMNKIDQNNILEQESIVNTRKEF